MRTRIRWIRWGWQPSTRFQAVSLNRNSSVYSKLGIRRSDEQTFGIAIGDPYSNLIMNLDDLPPDLRKKMKHLLLAHKELDKERAIDGWASRD